MRIRFVVPLLLFVICTGSVAPATVARPKVKVTIFQRGVPMPQRLGVYHLFKEPFSIRLKVRNVEDVYLNTSLTRDYFDIHRNEAVPDLDMISYKCYAEYPENSKKKLFVDSEGFSYLGYSPGADFHKFNLFYEHKKGYEGYRIVQRFHFTDTDEVIEVADMDQDLFLFLVATIEGATPDSKEEVVRDRFQIRWKS